MNITIYQKQLRKLYPNAVISVEMCDKHIACELKITPSIGEREYDESFSNIKEIFGDTLIERYTQETGHHFLIYQKYHSPSKEN